MQLFMEDFLDSKIHRELNVVFGPEIWSLQNQGGISRYFSELIRRIVLLNKNTYALIPDSENQHISEIPPDSRICYKNKSDNIAKLVDKRFLQSDLNSIYHASYYSKLHQSKLLCKNFKSIVTVHDLITEKYKETKIIRKPRIDIRKRSIESADHIICISNNTKSDLFKYYSVDESKVSVIYLGSNFEKFSLKKNTTLNKKPFLLFVGKRSGYKNFDVFIKAFSNSNFLRKNFDIVAIGGGVFSSDEIYLIKNLKLEDIIYQIEADDEKLANYIQGAEALIYPSLYEGFGLPPLEAMTLGCPVFTSRAGSIPEICENAAIYFDPRSVENIAHVIETSLNDSNLMKNMSTLGKLRSRNFTWDRTARETMMVYRDMAKVIL